MPPADEDSESSLEDDGSRNSESHRADPDSTASWDDESMEFPAGIVRLGPDLSALIGKTVDGRYRFLERIGTGGFSWVFRALQLSTDEHVAIKVPIRDGEPAERLRRGARLLGKLDHEYIAKLRDAGDLVLAEKRLPYVVMHLVEGARPLSTFCRDAGLDRPKILDLFAKVCDAVAAAHAHSIVHRDLKPGNILVNTSGKPMVIDFDIASTRHANLTTLQALSKTSAAFTGTLLYASPEQLGSNDVFPASDIFSLGVTLQELLIGRPPGCPLGLAIAVSTEPAIKVDSEIAASRLRRILRRCLRAKPGERYADAAELAADVRACLRAGTWNDPWWTGPVRDARHAVTAISHQVRQLAMSTRALATPQAVRRVGTAAAVALLVAAVAAPAVGKWLEERTKQITYQAAVATVATALETGDATDKVADLSRRAVASWRIWRGDTPPPLELVCLHNLSSGGQQVAGGGATTAAISPSGRWLAAGSPTGSVMLSRAAEPGVPRYRLAGFQTALSALVFGLHDRLAAGDADGRWKVWDLATIDKQSAPLVIGTAGKGPVGFDFAPRGGRLVVVPASGDVEVWQLPEPADRPGLDSATPATRISMVPIGAAAESQNAEAPSACLSPDGTRLFVAAAGGGLRVFDVETSAELDSVRGVGTGRLTLCRSADGSQLVSIAADGTVRRHDPATGRLLPGSTAFVPYHQFAAFTPDGQRLAVGSPTNQGSAGPPDIIGTRLEIFGLTAAEWPRPVLSVACPAPIASLSLGGDDRIAVKTVAGWRAWSADTLAADPVAVLATSTMELAGP